MRGRNKDFLVGGIKTIFRRNWDINIDSHEIDCSLTYSENFDELYNKKVKLNYMDN